MRAVIIVPETGEGAIIKILSLEHLIGYVPDSGFKMVEVNAPGTPIASVHWDGSKVVSGAYISPEQAAESAKQEAVDSTQNAVDARLAATVNSLLSFIESKYTLTVGEQKFVNDFHTDYEAWVAAKS